MREALGSRDAVNVAKGILMAQGNLAEETVMARSDRIPPDERERSALQDAVAFSGLSVEQLWVRYFGLGGSGDV